jgi:hypothetical protein
MATATFTEKLRQALEAFDGARTEGVALSEYAKARGLAIGDLRRGRLSGCQRLLPKPPRKSKSTFVAVRGRSGRRGGACRR